MTTEFTSLNLRPELMQAITELGYTEPTPIQAGMIPLMLTGVDVIGQAQTGTGKTAAFAFPILNNFTHDRHVQSLILAPTRELALQVADSMIEYGKHLNVRVLAVYGGQPYGPQISQLNRGVDIVVGTPGRLLDLIERKALNIKHVRTAVLDEADEMLNMGFIEDVEKILGETPAERQTALFSATLPTRIRTLASRFIREPQAVTIKRDTLTLTTTEQRYYLVHENDKTNALTASLRNRTNSFRADLCPHTRGDESNSRMNWWCAAFPLKPFTATSTSKHVNACSDNSERTNSKCWSRPTSPHVASTLTISHTCSTIIFLTMLKFIFIALVAPDEQARRGLPSRCFRHARSDACAKWKR